MGAGDKSETFSAGFGGAAVGMEYVKETGKGFGSYTPNPAIINLKYFKPCCFDIKKNVTTMNETPKGYQARSPIPSLKKMTDWIFDCGATDTMTYDPNDFLNLGSSSKTYIETASGEHVEVKGGGAIEFSRNMKLNNCLYIPTLSSKLLSISQVTKELNCVVLMYPTFCILQDILTREIIGRGTERGGLYYVDEVTHQGHAMLAHGTADRQLWLWHRRLGHPSFGYLKMLFPSLFLNKSTCMKCETCVLAKNHRVSFNPSNTRVKSIFSLVHSDVWGPAPNSKENRFKYFVLFVDDFSRMTWVYFMKHKSEVPEKFFMFYKMIQTQFNKKIQILRSDNGGEFVNQTMQNFIQENGLIHQTSCPNTPQQNGVVERRNRILLEKTRAMMIESQVPQSFWPEAVATSVYLLNRLPTQILGHKTPLKTLESQVTIPSVLTLPPRIFGCSIFIHIPKIHRDKLGPCAEKCVFVGYGPHQMGYRCYNPVSRRIHVTMDCDFLESEFYFNNQPRIQGERVRESLDWLSCSEAVPTEQVDGATESLTTNIGGADEPVYTTSESISEDVQQEVSESQHGSTLHTTNDDNSVPETEPEETKPEEPEVRVLPPRKNRGVPPNRFSPEHKKCESKYPIDGDRGRVGEVAKAFFVTLLSENIPRTAQEASKKLEWREAMNTEMKALEENNTWEKCVLPEGKKPVGCRWVFTIKYKVDGTIERYKARLVAKGYTQTYGIDYSETFSPVAKIDTIRVLLLIAANKDWPLHQFDVKNAFLHGDLKEEVYMEAPPGFSEEFNKNEVCRLKKALYGLKQSPRAWFGKFTMAMKKYGYKQSNADHTLFFKRRGELVTCLIIYVDDMIITGSDKKEITQLRENLFKEFEMKDLGG